MRTGCVDCSEIRSSRSRLTGGFYLSEDERAIRTLYAIKARSERLENLVDGKGIFRGPIFKRRYVNDPVKGLPYVSPNDLDRVFVEPAGYLSRSLPGDLLDGLKIHSKYILVTCSGMNLGKALFVRKDMENLIGSHDLIRVESSNEKIPQGYLYAFLAGRHGRAALRKQTYGGSVKHIEPEQLYSLLVPRLSTELESHVHDLVQSAAAGISNFVSVVRAATEELLNRCGIESQDSFRWLSDERHLGWDEFKCAAESLRAMNYDPRASKIRERILGGDFSFLGALCDPALFKGKIVFSRVDAEPQYGALLVGQRKAFRPRPDGRWVSRKSIKGLGLQVPAGTTLIPSHGTLGENELYCRALYVTPRTSSYAFSGDFFRCIPIPNSIPPGFLFAFLRSEPAFRLLRAISSGSKQQYQHPDMMWRLPIPRLGKEVEARIDQLVVTAAKRYDAALEADSQAIGLVDAAIEDAT